MEELQKPRGLQAVAAAVVLLGFVADFRPVVVIVAIALAAAFVVYAENVRMYGTTWVTEVALLALAAILFLAGRSGWAWVVAMGAAGVAATAAIADVWIRPSGQVRKPQ